MSKKNRNEMKKNSDQIANVPDPAVPNRAHTEMKNQNSSSGRCSTQSKNNNQAENKRG